MTNDVTNIKEALPRGILESWTDINYLVHLQEITVIGDK